MNGLDKHGVQDVRELLLKLKGEGRLILLASHNSEDIRILCDEIYEMEMGEIISCIRSRGEGNCMEEPEQ